MLEVVTPSPTAGGRPGNGEGVERRSAARPGSSGCLRRGSATPKAAERHPVARMTGYRRPSLMEAAASLPWRSASSIAEYSQAP